MGMDNPRPGHSRISRGQNNRKRDQRDLYRLKAMTASLKNEVRRRVLIEKKLEQANQRIQQMAETQLEQQEAYYESLLQSMNDLVVVLNDEGKIAKVFGPLKEITGFTIPEVVGQKDEFLFDEEEEEEEGDEIILLDQQVSREIEEKYYGRFQSLNTKGGGKIPISLTRSVFSSSKGEYQGFILIARPMKETKKLLKMAQIIEGIQSGQIDAIRGDKGIIQMMDAGVIAENERLLNDLTHSNRKLAIFAQTTSHDLKSPLLTISSFLQILDKEHKDCLNEEGAYYVRSALKSSQNMSVLIENLLEYARIREEKVGFEIVDLNEIVKDVVGDLQGAIQDTDAKILLNELPKIEVSAIHMQQVFQNLLGNAVKYRRKGVGLEISVESEMLKGDAAGGGAQSHCQIRVRDNGIGFDEKNLDKVFEPFKRLVNKKEYEGTGLGLATVKEIMELHQGSITAQSKVGEGSTFVVTLPVKQE